MSLFDLTIAIWNETNIKLQVGVSEELIFEFEEKLNFKFPEDFKTLYKMVNGFGDCDWNKDMFSLWPLEKIFEEYQLSSNKNFIGFCDYLINSYSMGYFKNENGIFTSLTSNKICETFEEFVDLLNSNSDKLY